MWTCSKCGEVHEGQFSSCWKCEAGPGPSRADGAGAIATAVQPAGVTVQLTQGTVAVVSFGPASKARYAEAYASAHTFSRIGKAVKWVGVAMFVLGLLGLIAGSGESSEYGGSDPMAVIGPLFTLMFGGLVYVTGIFMAAQAQLQMSTLDCAVHTSPFLTDTQRAETMRLRIA